MIEYTTGNLFESEAQALVNTVNTVGVMGKGVALQFKKKFPEYFKSYEDLCKKKEIKIGSVNIYQTGLLTYPQFICDFPTKEHWRSPSKMSYIESGLKDFREKLSEYNIDSVALPPLGCGHGGLNWADVKPLIEKYLSDLSHTKVLVYEPGDSNYSDNKKHAKAKLTEARAMLLSSAWNYSILGYTLTVLELQKLAYLLQRMGEPLRLKIQQAKYGPYADNLRFVIDALDGAYLHGSKHMDAKPFDHLIMEESRKDEIEDFLSANCTSEQKERLSNLAKLVKGFESPMGLELLASIDFVINTLKVSIDDDEAVIGAIRGWSPRKAEIMKDRFILIALTRIREYKELLSC